MFDWSYSALHYSRVKTGFTTGREQALEGVKRTTIELKVIQ